MPAGFTALSLTAYDVNIGATASGYANFALNTPDTIAGRVFVDYNGNRLFDPDDIPLAGVDVYLDESLRRFGTVFPACGSSNSAIELTTEELEEHSDSLGWVDVCKGWE